MNCSNNRRDTLAIFSLLALLISITGSVLYFVMAYLSGTMYKILFHLWVIFSILSIILPIVAKLIRKKNNQKGAKLETIAVFFAGLNFYYLIFLLTELPMIFGFLGWVICSFVYATIEKAITKRILLIIFAILLAVLLAVGTVFAVKYIKNNVGTTVISFESKTALSGDTVKIPIIVKKNHGLWGGQIKINYNANVLDFISCANGDVFDECEVNDTDGSVNLLVNQSELNDSKNNGTIATLNFKIKETAKKGNCEIVFDQSSNFCDKNSDLIEPILENGIIIVK